MVNPIRIKVIGKKVFDGRIMACVEIHKSDGKEPNNERFYEGDMLNLTLSSSSP